MSDVQEVKDYLVEMGCDEAVVFENPSYAEAFVGVSQDGRAVYLYEKMCAHLMEKEGMSEEDAVDFICYNTIRAIPYMGEQAPIVFYGLTSV